MQFPGFVFDMEGKRIGDSRAVMLDVLPHERERIMLVVEVIYQIA
jgi:hypothetical protein